MPDEKISELTPAVVINDADLIVIVQDGGNYNAPVGMVTGGLKRARVEVSSAEILALNSSPVELIEAPGAGKFIELVSGKVILIAGATPYTASGTVAILLGETDVFTQSIDANLSESNDTIQYMIPGATAVWPSEVEDLPVSLTAGTDPTDGDGTLVIDLLYRIVDLP